MTECRQQAFIHAPVDHVWKLVSDPELQTRWWPDTLVFECIDGQFEQGCRVRSVERRPWPLPKLETTLEVAELDPGHELFVRCMDTGTYTRAVLTEGQGGTFVEMEAGSDPESLAITLQVAAGGRRVFRHWVSHALEQLRLAAEEERAES